MDYTQGRSVGVRWSVSSIFVVTNNFGCYKWGSGISRLFIWRNFSMLVSPYHLGDQKILPQISSHFKSALINFFPPYKLIINRHLCLYLCRYVVVLNKLRSDQKLNPLMGNRIGNWLTLVRSGPLFLVTICTTTVSVRERRYCRSTNYCPSLHDVHRNGLLGDHWWYWQRADLDITLGW